MLNIDAVRGIARGVVKLNSIVVVADRARASPLACGGGLHETNSRGTVHVGIAGAAARKAWNLMYIYNNDKMV